MKNRKKFIIIVIIFLFVIFLSIFFINKSKKQKIGKNSSSQEIIDYILNISSYEATIEIEVNSNKNLNKYVLKQQYISDGTSTQEVLEPSNIKGIKISKKDNNLKIENTSLNLTTIFENYNYLGNNDLDLNSFIDDYKQSNEATYEEKNNEIILKTTSSNDNKYTKNKTLYIDRNTCEPTQMEITDINQNTTIYILYKEVKINSLGKQNVLAFNLYNMKKDV